MKKLTAFKAALHLFTITVIAALLCAAPVGAQEIDDCIACHKDINLTKTDSDGKVHGLFVDKALFEKSVHGEAGYTCVDCHEGATTEHPQGGLPDVNCAECHEEVAEAHKKSEHGKLFEAGDADAPTCYDCHTTHAVLPADNPESSVNADNLYITCGNCHEDEASPTLIPLAKAYATGMQNEVPKAGLITSLMSAVPTRVKGHGKVNMACDFDTQRCGNCHFEVMNHGEEEMKPEICASCHTTDRSTFLFGTIHKTGTVKSPLLMIMLVLLYGVGIALLVVFFKGGFSGSKKAAEEKTEEQQE